MITQKLCCIACIVSCFISQTIFQLTNCSTESTIFLSKEKSKNKTMNTLERLVCYYHILFTSLICYNNSRELQTRVIIGSYRSLLQVILKFNFFFFSECVHRIGNFSSNFCKCYTRCWSSWFNQSVFSSNR